MNSIPDQLFRPPAASNYLKSRWGLRATIATLAKMRHVGTGPRFRKAGRDVAYEVAALDEWAKARLSAVDYGSTVEAAAAANPKAA